MSSLKQLLKDCTPPLLVRTLRRFRQGGVRFEGEYSNWEEAASRCTTGYADEEILKKVLQAARKVQQGDAAYERDSVTFPQPEYVWPVLAGLMWSAARHGGRLHVLDFGGSLGSSYFQYRKFLGKVRDLRWSIVEQPHYVEAGQKYMQSESLSFHASIEAATALAPPNTILISSSLQYIPQPHDILKRLSASGATCLIMDRTPFSDKPHDIVTVQRVPSSIYFASYPMRIFSLDNFRKEMKDRHQWSLVSSHDCPEGHMQTNRKSELFYKGMIMESAR